MEGGAAGLQIQRSGDYVFCEFIFRIEPQDYKSSGAGRNNRYT